MLATGCSVLERRREVGLDSIYICAPANCLVTDLPLPISFPQLLHIFVLKVSARFFGPCASAESSLSAVPSSPRETSLKRKAAPSKSDRQSRYEPFRDHRIVEVAFRNSVDECTNSKSLFGRIHRERHHDPNERYIP
jgi:hypothetical protein